MRGALGDPDRGSDLPQPRVWIRIDVQQHVAVI
jgi:hypothetical protein